MTQATYATDVDRPQVHLFAAVCGWLLPGLGHALIGERRRGLIIGAAVGTLWLGGLLLGGVTVIDRYAPPDGDQSTPGRRLALPFLGQAMIAPSWLVAVWNVRYAAPTWGYPPPAPQERNGAQAPYSPSFGRMNEQGVLYTALAGLLNLLAIIDVVYREPGPRRPRLEADPVRPAEPADPADPANPGSGGAI